jgi:hypothetical protein
VSHSLRSAFYNHEQNGIDFNRPQPSQAKLLITNNLFCIVQRATAKSKTGIFCDYGVAEAPPGFQAGWSDCMYSVYFAC